MRDPERRMQNESQRPGRTVLVVGGGPAGMAAALSAARYGAQVTLLERRPKPGKKLLATGNGRCNLANRGQPVYFGDPDFALQVLAVMPPGRVMRQLEDWGLPLMTDPEGRVYPATQQASSVFSLLCERMRGHGVRLLTDTEVISVHNERGLWTAACADGRCFAAERLVLATGGLAGGALGNRREDYALAESLGHSVTPLFPGLAPLELRLTRFRRLSGLRVPARLTLCDGHTPHAGTAGEILFTDHGLSGICAMQLARDAQQLLADQRKPLLQVDLSPIFFPEDRAYARTGAENTDSFQKTLRLLKERERRFGRDGMLTGLLPDKLIGLCQENSLDALAGSLTGLRLEVSGVRPFEQAQITCGGVSTAGVDPQTMASRLCPGLYLAGELLDVDGDCGGYNLQFAFAGGLLAGKNAAIV